MLCVAASPFTVQPNHYGVFKKADNPKVASLIPGTASLGCQFFLFLLLIDAELAEDFFLDANEF